MYLKYVQIRNFRNHSASKFSFEEGTNTIIGENDSGKSNAMTALRILLDSSFSYGVKQLKETDFSDLLVDWRGEWIIISAMFDKITETDKTNEVCAELIPREEDELFLKSFIRCADTDYGTVTLYIRPVKSVRQELAKANDNNFNDIRKRITLADYEFFYTFRSQADFLDDDIYKSIVGDIENQRYVNPEEDNSNILGCKADILNVWQHVSLEFIDALRDVDNEMRKVRNPLRRVFDVISCDLNDNSKQDITSKIHELNATISSIPEISAIGVKLSERLNDIVGLIYAPNVVIESRIKEDIDSLARFLSVSSANHDDIECLGLGHLNILYIALKLIEFEYKKNHEILNIVIVEEPEAHIHIHIQKTLFENLKMSKEYTQIIMTTHSTHISEVSDVRKINVLKSEKGKVLVMNPVHNLDEFGKENLKINKLQLSNCLKRYLDAKRSVLLFSKGVILVEGDGEEILLQAMIKKALGVSLDEIGIGLINIGNIAFEYIASIFHNDRIQRRCAIVTDSDAILEGACKCKPEAAKMGNTRKVKLENLFKNNRWVKSFYAPYTFEIDFANESANRTYIKEIIKTQYISDSAVETHIENIVGNDEAKRYDSVLTIANKIGKGWYATLLASYIDEFVVIPQYLVEAVAFASLDILSENVVRKMASHVIRLYENYDEKLLKEEYDVFLDEFTKGYPKTVLTQLLKAREKFKRE